jgi:hypothetical protein
MFFKATTALQSSALQRLALTGFVSGLLWLAVSAVLGWW